VPSDRVKLHVSDVHLAVPASVGVEAGMVVLTEDQPPGRSLRIIVGQPEARAIQAARDGSIPSRPSTWDLFVSAVALLGGRIQGAVITAVEQERHYFAAVEFEHDGERRTLSCRPSDAVALALRSYHASLEAEAQVLDEAGVLADGTKPGPIVIPSEADAAADRERELAEREAALATRERELAEREAALGHTGPEKEPAHDEAALGHAAPEADLAHHEAVVGHPTPEKELAHQDAAVDQTAPAPHAAAQAPDGPARDGEM
jgi:bifunctional DNase/RNase